MESHCSSAGCQNLCGEKCQCECNLRGGPSLPGKEMATWGLDRERNEPLSPFFGMLLDTTDIWRYLGTSQPCARASVEPFQRSQAGPFQGSDGTVWEWGAKMHGLKTASVFTLSIWTCCKFIVNCDFCSVIEKCEMCPKKWTENW